MPGPQQCNPQPLSVTIQPPFHPPPQTLGPSTVQKANRQKEVPHSHDGFKPPLPRPNPTAQMSQGEGQIAFEPRTSGRLLSQRSAAPTRAPPFPPAHKVMMVAGRQEMVESRRRDRRRNADFELRGEGGGGPLTGTVNQSL